MDDKKRVLLSVLLVVIGVTTAVLAGIVAESEPTEQAQGTVFDFGDYETEWVELKMSIFDNTGEVLEYASTLAGIDLVMSSDGTISSLGGLESNEKRQWNLWIVYPDSNKWVKMDAPYNQDPKEYTITCWAYCSENDEPAVAVDYMGNPIYGYDQMHRVVSLSPSITEILGSVKASNIIVGVDTYSNHPDSIEVGRSEGSIKNIGTYTGPSFELITSTNPDVVFCDGGQRSHINMSMQLRNSDIDSVVLYPGEDIDCIMNNIFTIGIVIGYTMAADEVLGDISYVIDNLSRICHSSSVSKIPDAMVSLEPDISPWVSGDNTYMDNMLDLFNSNNVFAGWNSWVHLTSERISSANPSKIIILTTEYRCSQEEYDYLYNHLSPQWKSTDAWKNGEIYVFCESASEMMQRFGPRTSQVAELTAMALHPECFDVKLPKIVGDNYQDYLKFSSGMDYN